MSVKRLVPTHIFASTSAPVAQRVGDSYFDPVQRSFNVFDGTAWATFNIGSGGSGGAISVDGGSPSSTYVTVIDGGGV